MQANADQSPSPDFELIESDAAEAGSDLTVGQSSHEAKCDDVCIK